MKKRLFLIGTLATFLMTAISAWAMTTTFSPNPSDLYDLDHNYAYKWGINYTVPSDQHIVGASIFFNDIRNFDNNPNVLYLTLMDNGPTSGTDGVTRYYDNQATPNYFAASSFAPYTVLHQYSNLTTTARDITYTFDSSELTTLIGYLQNGNTISLGFDPDCHYYNNGITFTIETAGNPVPEPATMLLFGTGMAGLASWGRSRRKEI